MTSPDDFLVDASRAAAAATANLTGPPPLSESPGAFQEPPEQSGSAPTATEPDLEAKEFDPRWRQPFEGLIYLGRLEDEFSMWGHRFRLVTPSQLERLQLGVVHAPYNNTLSTEIAFETALVAAYLVQIDGHDLPMPVMNNAKDQSLRDRFVWVTENLQRPVINRIYERCLVLEEQVDGVLAAMGEARG